MFTHSRLGYFFLGFLLVLIVSVSSIALSETSFEEQKFFSYKRFFLEQSVIQKIPRDGKIKKEIRRFEDNFTNGLYAISSGDLENAEERLKKARLAWPEYYGTDFLLGSIYEEKGSYSLAARYYKSYLIKLKKLESGEYRISGPLIVGLTTGGVESYALAYALIKSRLNLYGIDIDRVLPIFTPPEFLLPILLGLTIALFYAAAVYWVAPKVKRRHRLKNPPEGFWICPHCDTANPVLDKECMECHRKRPEENG